MIFVTVGNHVQPFNRLICSMDLLATRIEEEVVIQTGHSTYQPLHANYFQFAPGRHILELTREARIQVSHAGSGSILTALRFETPLVVAPRRKQYNEHIDDHQLQLTSALAAQGKLVPVYEINLTSLATALEKAEANHRTRDNGGHSGQLVGAVRQYLCWLSEEKRSQEV